MLTFNFVERARSPWLFAGCLAVAFACATGCEPAATPDATPIAAVHRAQCSRCHTAPQPHHLDKGTLEEAFARHRGRVHLSEDEWAAMVDYLAAGSARLDGASRTSQR